MKLSERVKTKMQKWLEVRPASEIGGIVIREPYSFETDAIRNRIWYRGDADELKQLYAQIPGTDAGCSRFWAAVPTGDTVRKMHTGYLGLSWTFWPVSSWAITTAWNSWTTTETMTRR